MATYLEVKKQIEALQKEAETLKATERQGVIDRMREAIEVYEITAAELGFSGAAGKRTGGKTAATKTGAKSKRSSSSKSYSDGKGNTWGGRGPRPAWLKEALEGGAKLEDFAAR